jgi:hypothetical protein
VESLEEEAPLILRGTRVALSPARIADSSSIDAFSLQLKREDVLVPRSLWPVDYNVLELGVDDQIVPTLAMTSYATLRLLLPATPSIARFFQM